MNRAVIEKNLRKTRILVAPLDWGLGHATRCIPIIRELLGNDQEVWLAGEGAQEELLKTEFPALPFLPLQGYRARYAASATGLLWQILVQSPRFFQTIKQENTWLKYAVKEYELDAVISDNRYGLYHTEIPSVFISHQLTIKTHFGKWSESMIRKTNYRYIDRFTECWVPDAAGKDNLAGELSHPVLYPRIPVKYTGALSRFNKNGLEEKKDHLLFLLSGPEPQRTILENIIIKAIAYYPGTATVVRGLPGTPSVIPSTNMIRFYNHLPSGELNNEMLKAEYIISRSGYSTIMDLATMQKKSILVPTPGQTEQEYLGDYLHARQLAVCIPQKRFSLFPALEKAKKFNYHFSTLPAPALPQTVQSFIGSLQPH